MKKVMVGKIKYEKVAKDRQIKFSPTTLLFFNHFIFIHSVFNFFFKGKEIKHGLK